MLPNTAQFRFYAELNDFLPPDKKQRTFDYTFGGHPAVKDAVEALGVPHPEIDLIVADGESVDFQYHLRDGDRVAVYPVFEGLDITPLVRLRPEPLRRSAFVLDEQLGKLARNLRMLGFDTHYQNKTADKEIIRNADQDKRIILTRDRSLLKNSRITRGYWVRSADPDTQIREVLQRFNLFGHIHPLTRCLACNTVVEKADKQSVRNRLLPGTQDRHWDFYQCPSCGKLYWEGSHVRRMRAKIAAWMAQVNDPPPEAVALRLPAEPGGLK